MRFSLTRGLWDNAAWGSAPGALGPGGAELWAVLSPTDGARNRRAAPSRRVNTPRESPRPRASHRFGAVLALAAAGALRVAHLTIFSPPPPLLLKPFPPLLR